MQRVNLRRLPDDWGADEEALLQAIDDATATPVEIDRKLAEEWFAGIGWVLDDLQELAVRRPVIAIELAEHLLVGLEAALGLSALVAAAQARKTGDVGDTTLDRVTADARAALRARASRPS